MLDGVAAPELILPMCLTNVRPLPPAKPRSMLVCGLKTRKYPDKSKEPQTRCRSPSTDACIQQLADASENHQQQQQLSLGHVLLWWTRCNERKHSSLGSFTPGNIRETRTRLSLCSVSHATQQKNPAHLSLTTVSPPSSSRTTRDNRELQSPLKNPADPSHNTATIEPSSAAEVKGNITSLQTADKMTEWQYTERHTHTPTRTT